MFFPNGVRTTSRGENSDDLELLQVIVESARPTSDFLRTVAVNSSSSSRPRHRRPTPEGGTDSGSQSSQSWSEGDSVYVNSTDVNLRDSPSINGGLVTVLLYGQEMIIDGEPTDADGIIWWPVHIADGPTLAGYVTQEFIQSDPVAVNPSITPSAVC